MVTADLPLLTFPDLAIPGCRHVLTTRHGGVSAGGCATLNLGFHVGDDPACVTENRRRVGAAAGYDSGHLVAAQQVHGTEIALLSEADRGCGATAWDTALPGIDGLVVAAPHLPTAILVADCAPLLLIDPVRHVLAVLHAGWRGALAGIASRAVRLMGETYGTAPGDLRVGIGPALCPECLEVGVEVAEAVRAACGPAVIDPGSSKPHLDLRGMVLADLARVGVSPAQVCAPMPCTRCRVDLFFSHRGQAGGAGRFGLIAWWEG